MIGHACVQTKALYANLLTCAPVGFSAIKRRISAYLPAKAALMDPFRITDTD